MKRVLAIASLAVLPLAGTTAAAPTLSFPNATVAQGGFEAERYGYAGPGAPQGQAYGLAPSPDFGGGLPQQGGGFPQQGGGFSQHGGGFPQQNFGATHLQQPGFSAGAPLPGAGYATEAAGPAYGYQPYQPMPQTGQSGGYPQQSAHQTPYPTGHQGSYPEGYQSGFPGGYQPYQPAPATYPSPGDTLQYGIERLTAWVNSRPQGQPEELRRFLGEEIGPLLDFDTMTRWALGPMNRSVTTAQYARVRGAVESMFLDAMARQLAGHSVSNIEYLRPRGNPADGEVQLGIRVSRDGMPLELQFRLNEGPFGWRVIDVEAEGASAVRYYRQVLSELAGRYGLDGMIQRLGS